MDTIKLIKELEEIYGKDKGMTVFRTIMPGIIADFDKMLNAAAVGELVTEDYRLEDRKATLRLTGKRTAGGAGRTKNATDTGAADIEVSVIRDSAE